MQSIAPIILSLIALYYAIFAREELSLIGTPEFFLANNVVPEDTPDHIVTIKYCAACQYKSSFVRTKHFLAENAIDNLEIIGGDLEPSPAIRLAKKTYNLAYYSVLALFLFGSQIIAALRLTTAPFIVKAQTHPLVLWIINNKGTSILMLYTINMLMQNVFSSGSAFEIFLGSKLIWSSLKSQRLPTEFDIIDAFSSNGVAFRGY